MSTRPAVAALTGTIAFAASGAALAATPAQNKQFANKTMRPLLVKSFKKQAPKLILGEVTCVLPKDGTVVHCKAHFSDLPDNANIVYLIKATLHESGVLTWTTTTHSCTNAKTGKKLAC